MKNMILVFIALAAAFFSAERVTASVYNESSLVDVDLNLYFGGGAPFKVKSTSVLYVYGAGDTPIEAAIMRVTSQFSWGDQYGRFQSYKSYKAIKTFKGTRFVGNFKASKGTYIIAYRNADRKNGGGSIQLEVDYLKGPKGYSYKRTVAKGSGILSPSISGSWNSPFIQTRKTIPFQIAKNRKYVIDGSSQDIEFWIIDQYWSQAFINHENYYYYSAFNEKSSNAPGRWVVSLPPGDYCLAMGNGAFNESPYAFSIDEYKK